MTDRAEISSENILRCSFYMCEIEGFKKRFNLCIRAINTHLSDDKSYKSQTVLDILSIYNVCEKFKVCSFNFKVS